MVMAMVVVMMFASPGAMSRGCAGRKCADAHDGEQ
jgi:hypothetical protein